MEILCKNNNKSFPCKPGMSFSQILEVCGRPTGHTALCANANGRIYDMSSCLYEDADVEFLDVTTNIGARVYCLGLVFLLSKAVSELFPGGSIRVSNAISKGFYCPVEIGRVLTGSDIRAIEERMHSLVERDLPFVRHTAHTTQVADIMRKAGREDTALLLETGGTIYSTYYTLEDMPDWFFGVLPPSTGCLDLFGIVSMEGGVLVRVPQKSDPSKLEPMVRQEKMFNIFYEHHEWMSILGFSTIGELNRAIAAGQTNMIINVAEALQAKKIVHIADSIVERRNENGRLKLVLISGPSSSGKTTFSKRLQVQLMAHGLTPKVLSLDDYFMDREHTPLDENGEYDFESLYAIDLPFFNMQLKQLLAGETVQTPTFNFKKGGVREFTGKPLTLGTNDILLIEGIHALNPELIPDIPEECRFLIYVSALTSIRIDNHNYIPTTDNRLLRRITRDHKYRSYSAQNTIARWASVRNGEEKWIFPYQENADAMFNSAMLFEIAVIKDMVASLLDEVPANSDQYIKASQLRDFLKLFHAIPSQNLPPTSLVREFIGGSSFHY